MVLADTLGLGLSCWPDVAGASARVVGVPPKAAGEGPVMLCLDSFIYGHVVLLQSWCLVPQGLLMQVEW